LGKLLKFFEILDLVYFSVKWGTPAFFIAVRTEELRVCGLVAQ
jgi:hypothetical protein